MAVPMVILQQITLKCNQEAIPRQIAGQAPLDKVYLKSTNAQINNKNYTSSGTIHIIMKIPHTLYTHLIHQYFPSATMHLHLEP
jgi:hypothetical protein